MDKNNSDDRLYNFIDLKANTKLSKSEDEKIPKTFNNAHKNEAQLQQGFINSTEPLIYKSKQSLEIDSKCDSFLMCRICHEETHSDLLISPCKCNGTLNFVHQACLSKWLQVTGMIFFNHIFNLGY
jgi:hypothetical protein